MPNLLRVFFCTTTIIILYYFFVRFVFVRSNDVFPRYATRSNNVIIIIIIIITLILLSLRSSE
jgi:hypothetical protein